MKFDNKSEKFKNMTKEELLKTLAEISKNNKKILLKGSLASGMGAGLCSAAVIYQLENILGEFGININVPFEAVAYSAGLLSIIVGFYYSSRKQLDEEEIIYRYIDDNKEELEKENNENKLIK